MKAILRKIRKKLAEGVPIPSTNFSAKFTIEQKTIHSVSEVENRINIGLVKKLIDLFPQLQLYYHPSIEQDHEAIQGLLEFYYSYIPFIHQPARETQLRNLLHRFNARINHPEFKKIVRIEICKSDMRSGVIDRAIELLEDSSVEEGIQSKLKGLIAKAEEKYGAKEGLIPLNALWKNISADRGRCLVKWLEANKLLLQHKKILHIAPEPESRARLLSQKEVLKFEYLTLDAFYEADLKDDLCSLTLSDRFADVCLCHRVLEHITDDTNAIREIYRILKPNGFLSVSVPQSMQMDTNEWVIPDLTHDGHVRQYGADFEQKLVSAGFVVKVESLLLDKNRDDHVRDRTYPMRFYTATKPIEKLGV